MALIREIDIPISGEGRINVYSLENANAEDVASTLQSLAQGTANRRARRCRAAAHLPRPRPGAGAAELFQGEVKISADKATNSLVIIASQNDYRSLVRVIEKLDIPRRQVFVEAVIMEVNLDRTSELGINLHGGIPLNTDQGDSAGAASAPSTPARRLAALVLHHQPGQLRRLPRRPAGAGDPQRSPSWASTFPPFGVVLNALQTSSAT